MRPRMKAAARFGVILWASLALAYCFPASADTGWDQMLAGATAAHAEEAFHRDLDKDPADVSAAYGLALIQQARGEREKAVVTAIEGLRSAPSNPLAFLLEDLLGDDATFNKATTRLVSEALPLLTEKPDTDPMVRFTLRWLAYELASRTGDRVTRMQAMRAAGFIPGAQFSKAMSELSRTAFSEVGPAETGHLSGESWTYSELQSLQCRPPAYRMPQGKEYDYYALVEFSLGQASEAMFYFNAATSFKVILDDRPILVKDIFTVQEDPTSVRRVMLNAGAHRLLLKVHSGRSEQGVHVALMDAQGNPLKIEPRGAGPVQGGATAGFVDRGEWRGSFQESFPAKDARFAGFSALWHHWRGDVAGGRLMMEDAAAAAPKCLAWNLWVARMYLMEADDLPPKIAQSRAEKSVEAALSVDPALPLPLFFKAMLQGANSDGEENLVTLSKLVENYPSDPRWFLALASQFQDKGWLHQARSVLEQASSYHPECESVESAWIAFLQRIPDPASQAEAIMRLSALRNVDSEWEDYYRSTGKWEELHALMEAEAIRYGDPDLRYEEELGKLELRMGNPGAARKRFEKLARLNPTDVAYALSLAKACFLQGDEPAGRKAWASLKDAKPDAFQVDLARWALGEPMPFQDKHLDLARVLAEDTTKSPDASPSSLLLDQMFTRVQKDGSSLERYHGIIKINDKEGVDRESEQSLPGQVILMLRTVKPDGRILEPEQIPDKDTISMPGVEAGDIIEYEYLTLKQPSGVKPNAYVTTQVYLFQDIEKPFHRTQWYLEWPDSIPMQFHEQNLPDPGRKGSSNGINWRDWDFRDMPRVAPEPDTPNKTLFIPLVEAVGGVDWKDLGRFLKEGITGSCQVTPEVEKRYRDAVGDAKTPEEKLDKIVRYLLQEVDSTGSGGWLDPTQTLLTRQGSRLPVAAAFLTLAKIPFRILTAEAVPDRVYRENLPRLGQFAIPVLKVELPSGTRYLTLASPYRDPYTLAWYLQGARATDLTSSEPWKESEIPADFGPWTKALEEETRELTPDGNLRVVHHQTLDPEASESLRGALRRMDKDQWRQAVQMALSKQHGNLDLEDFSVGNMDDPFKPLRWDYTILIQGYALSEGGQLTVPDPLPSLHLGQVFASLRDRKLPLTTGAPIFANQKFVFRLPAGAKADYPMPALDLKTAFGSYHLKTSGSGSEILVERSVRVPYQIVWPSKYGEFSSFMKRIDEAESGQMVVSIH